MNKPDVIARYADACAIKGVQPHVWGYPWKDRIELFVEHLHAITTKAQSVVGLLPDPELGLKRAAAEAAILLQLLRQTFQRLVIGFTSFGLPTGHPSFPFEEFAAAGVSDPRLEVDYGSPQLYTGTKRQILRGLEDYQELGFDAVVPSFGMYKWVRKNPGKPMSRKNRRAKSLAPAELLAHLEIFITSPVSIAGMIGWAENFANQGLWRVLAQFAEWLDRGACMLPVRPA